MTQDDSIPMQLGEVRGKLIALEERVDRHETFVGAKLTSIESKLDQALTNQTKGSAVFALLRMVAYLVAGASGWITVMLERKG